MTALIIISVIVIVGLLAAAGILFNEQLAKWMLNKKFPSNSSTASGVHKIADLIDKIRLSDIMSSKVVSIMEEEPFGEVARRMKAYDIRHLPVVSKQGNLVGIITQRMLYQIRSPRKLIDGDWYYDDEMLNDIILKNVMEKEVTSLTSDQSMGKALLKMAYSRCGAIPIVDQKNNLVGIVTRKDILKSLATIYQAS